MEHRIKQNAEAEELRRTDADGAKTAARNRAAAKHAQARRDHEELERRLQMWRFKLETAQRRSVFS